MPLRVDVGQHGHEEGGGVPLGEELPAAGLAELQETAGMAVRGLSRPSAPGIALGPGLRRAGQ